MQEYIQCKSDTHFRNQEENVRAQLMNDYEFELHLHDFYELNIILSGHGVHRIGERAVQTVRGDVFVIPPLVPHGYSNKGGLCVFHLLFRTDFLKTCKDLNRVEGIELLLEIEPLLRQTAESPFFLKLKQWDLLAFEAALLPMVDGGTLDYTGAHAAREHTALAILFRMAHLMTEQQKNSTFTGHDSAVIDAIRYIHEHYKETIRIDDLCRITYMSKSTLLRAFQSICGCTPTHYLIRYRVKIAAEMMQTVKNKTFVAHECGFYDLSHMERSFRTEGFRD